jgi:hypothetical protein
MTDIDVPWTTQGRQAQPELGNLKRSFSKTPHLHRLASIPSFYLALLKVNLPVIMQLTATIGADSGFN